MSSEIFGYKPLNTFFHRLDPRVKFAVFFSLTLPAVSWNDPIFLTALLFSILAMTRLAKVSMRLTAKFLLYLTPALLFLLLYNLLFYESSIVASRPSWPLDSLFYLIPQKFWVCPCGHVSLESLVYAWGAMDRITIIALSGRFLLSVTSPDNLASAMVKLRIPNEITTAINVAFGFMPVLLAQLNGVVEAQRARGWEARSKNPVTLVRKAVPTIVPVLVRSLTRAEFLAAAISSKGYGLDPKKRTYLREIVFRRTDWVVFIILIAFIAFGQAIGAASWGLGWADYRFTTLILRHLLGLGPY
ncbi:MAG: energy-coupling factor transporter transmembrane protein EcfT [Nitrososphaerales archaeon]|nr:energy-coupling factor transporter transmembrane protein EcfT [Nitrososphaerales archaeon]